MDVYKQLEKIYYDPQRGFVSADKLYKVAKQYNINCTQKDVNNFLDKQAVVQVFREQRRPHLFSSIIAEQIRHE